MKKSFFELDKRPQVAGPFLFLAATYVLVTMLLCVIVPFIWVLGILSAGFYLGLYLSLDDPSIRSSLGSEWYEEFQWIKYFLIGSSIFLIPQMIGMWWDRKVDS